MRPIIVPSKYPVYTDTRYNQEAENSPVNVTVCHGLRKPTSKTLNQFSMHFVGTDIYWNFNSIEQRDEEFQRILNMFSYQDPEEVIEAPGNVSALVGYPPPPEEPDVDFGGGDYGR